MTPLCTRRARLVQRHYPLPPGLIDQLERERTEAWEQADQLRDRAARGEDVPENSAEFIAVQRFQQSMTLRALELVLGDWIDANLDDIILPLVDFEALRLGTADAVSWGHIEERRMRFVRAAHEYGAPSDPLGGRVAQESGAASSHEGIFPRRCLAWEVLLRRARLFQRCRDRSEVQVRDVGRDDRKLVPSPATPSICS